EFTGGGKLAEQYFVLLSEELNVRSVNWQGGDGSLEVKLDTVITLELQREGNKREIIRTINSLRKEAGLTVADRIEILIESSEESFSWLAGWSEELKKATLADVIRQGREDNPLAVKVLKLEQIDLSLQIVKL
ncbi:MAG TPA: DUF5915 domain-containing protein, partial [bacterium]|nr:DUF5915 domain-containing protein [bacterium]